MAIINEDRYFDQYEERQAYTPEQRMPKLYPREENAVKKSSFALDEGLWCIEVEKSLDYIAGLSEEERESLFFIKAVHSKTRSGHYIKVLHLENVGISELVDLLNDPKTILMTTKEDD